MLRTVTGGVGASGLAGIAAGRENRDARVEVNVGYAAARGRRAAERAATRVVRRFAFDAMTVEVNERAIPGLRRRGGVRYVERNGTMHALNPGNGKGNGKGNDRSGDTASETLPWGVDRVDADVAHAEGATGAGADVAIIDTGIDSDHSDLSANLGEGTAFVECQGGSCNYSWDDDEGHGTHCAGIADAVDDSSGVVGVSTAATLHAVKVLDKHGSGSFSDVAAGIEWTARNEYDVGSLSLGASSGSATVRDACRYAYDRGVLLVAAAGNTGPCTDCVGYPAAYDTVMAVTATAADDSLADFSSTGPEVELAAPGRAIYSTYPGGYETLSGTSMAAPHVAGAGAQLVADGYANDEARERLAATAEDVGVSASEAGAGLLDVAAALGYDSSDDR